VSHRVSGSASHCLNGTENPKNRDALEIHWLRLIRQFILVAGASTLGAAAPGNVHAQGMNALEIVIGNGPQAGTYKLPATNTICLRTKQPNQFSAAYKDLKARDPRTPSGAGINVFNPDEAGPKQGDINIRSDISRSGLTFQGQTKEGIMLHVTAKGGQINEF
jgi:hypothetical protein